MKEQAQERLAYNLQILRILEAYLMTYSDLRFCQALSNLDIVRNDKDDFYTESSETLRRVKQALEERGGQ
jgi:hypothetical protein